jgi:c(7)-type cytochrome triheme protein
VSGGCRNAKRGGRLAVGFGLALAALAACSPEARQRILPYFFDGVPESGALPPTRRIQQDLTREVEELRREVADLRAAAEARRQDARRTGATPPLEEARTWEDARRLLPTHPGGGADWEAAVSQGLLRPQAGLAPDSPARAVYELDVRLVSDRASRLFEVHAPHAVHTQWLACTSCHPSTFPVEWLSAGSGHPRGGSQKMRTTAITGSAIPEPPACGVCHGRVAFSFEACARCHLRIPARDSWQRPPARAPLEQARTWAEAEARIPVSEESPDWTRALADGLLAPGTGPGGGAAPPEVLDLDVERTPKGGEELKVVFRHASHTALLVCDSCHPAPFAQEAGATPISMAQIDAGQLCGRCHGTVAFPPAACVKCHPGLGG